MFLLFIFFIRLHYPKLLLIFLFTFFGNFFSIFPLLSFPFFHISYSVLYHLFNLYSFVFLCVFSFLYFSTLTVLFSLLSAYISYPTFCFHYVYLLCVLRFLYFIFKLFTNPIFFCIFYLYIFILLFIPALFTFCYFYQSSFLVFYYLFNYSCYLLSF